MTEQELMELVTSNKTHIFTSNYLVFKYLKIEHRERKETDCQITRTPFAFFVTASNSLKEVVNHPTYIEISLYGWWCPDMTLIPVTEEEIVMALL